MILKRSRLLMHQINAISRWDKNCWKNLGAFEMVRTKSGEKRQLTAVGRQLSQLPVDPRLAKMLLTAVSQVRCMK